MIGWNRGGWNMKNLKMDSEVIIYGIIIVVIGAFVFFLPEIDEALRNLWQSL